MTPVAPLHVLYEDNHCLAVAKPAGWLTMGDRSGDPTLLEAAKDYVRRTCGKPGAVFLGVVHRLDRPVSGVLLFARTSKAASRLSEQFREHRVEKVYWALISGNVPEGPGELVHELLKDTTTNIVRVVSRAIPDSRTCRLAYRRLSVHEGISLVEIRPQTGRSHQIRVQLAHSGWVIVGDRKYGSTRNFAPGQIALHARSLTFSHPTLKHEISLTCDPPASWRRWEPRSAK